MGIEKTTWEELRDLLQVQPLLLQVGANKLIFIFNIKKIILYIW